MPSLASPAMDARGRSPLRLLAPIALLAFAFALIVVVTSADVEERAPTPAARQAEERDLGGTATTENASRSEADERAERLPDEVYVVKAGDTLAGIAQKLGLTVERLQALNPELDPQALVSGQKIKLKE